MVGAGRFELPTPGPPDRCANRAALRSALRNQIFNPSGFGNRERTEYNPAPGAPLSNLPLVGRSGVAPYFALPLRYLSALRRRGGGLANPAGALCSSPLVRTPHRERENALACSPQGESGHEVPAGADGGTPDYFIVIARPLRSAFAISPTCRPESSRTAPCWLVSTIARTPAPTASPAPAAA